MSPILSMATLSRQFNQANAWELNSHNLSWNKHLETTTMKGKRSLGFLHHNLGTCSPEIEAHCYNTFVRPRAEYAGCVWSPSTKKGIDKVESIQRSAARYVMNDYSRQSNVTTLLQDLGWDSLQQRREVARVTMIYSITNKLIDIPDNQLIPANRTTRGNNQKFKSSYHPYHLDERPVLPWHHPWPVSGMICLSKLWTRQHCMSLRPGSAMFGSPSQMSPYHQFLTL